MKKYFCLSNTSDGLVNLAENNVKGIANIYSINSNIKTALDKLVRKIGEFYEAEDKEVEYIVYPLDFGLYSGVIVREADLAVLDSTLYGSGKELAADECIGEIEMSGEIKNFLHKMHEEYKKAKKIHDDWEKIYIKNMDFKKLNDFSEKTVNMLLSDNKSDKEGVTYSRFFGASAPGGSVNYINLLTDGLEKRYFIKGRPGTGKSTFLKKLAKEAANRGFETEIYYCSFDPHSLDMVVVRELGFCVFDSTAPHELFPMKESDSILDFYVEASLEGIDEKYEKELSEISKKYSDAVNKGVEFLDEAIKIHTLRERLLSSAIEEKKIEKIAEIICK